MRVTEGDLLAAINELSKEQPKRPSGKGWERVSDMAKREGVSLSAIRQRMRLALEKGLQVERFTGSDYDASGTLHKQTWFRVKRS